LHYGGAVQIPELNELIVAAAGYAILAGVKGDRENATSLALKRL